MPKRQLYLALEHAWRGTSHMMHARTHSCVSPQINASSGSMHTRAWCILRSATGMSWYYALRACVW